MYGSRGTMPPAIRAWKSERACSGPYFLAAAAAGRLGRSPRSSTARSSSVSRGKLAKMARCRPQRSASPWLAALLLTTPAVALAGAEPSQPSLHPLLLNSSVNGHRSDEPQLFLRDAEGRTYVSESFLK